MKAAVAIALAIGLTAALAGCAELEQAPAPVRGPAPPSPPPVIAPPPAPAPATVPAPVAEPEENRQATELLGYTQRFAQMSADEQRREIGALNQVLARDRSSYSRVKLGLLYALPGTVVQDDARALAVLEPVAGGTGALKQLGALVYGQVSERVKVQKRADQLKDQLEALRDVERSIIERGQQTQPKRP